MKIKFLGAVQNVTGSRFLLETGDSRILVDCGLFQEWKLRSRNWEDFPVKPESINAVLLTHAHIDHCGYLPKLVKDGFKGNIICTPPTAEIANIALLDSAFLQEMDAAHKRDRHKREKRKSPYPVEALYTTEDAEKVKKHFKTVSYSEPVTITPSVKAIFHIAGHILGSSIIELRVIEDGKEKICIFAGDIGRWNRPILRDPTLIKKAHYVFMESTYGNRLHEDESNVLIKLQQTIQGTYEKGGNLIIPAFSIERTQELIYCINNLLREDKIPHLLCFVDSPMAINVTKVFRKHLDYFDKKAKHLLDEGERLFSSPLLKYTQTVPESKAINKIKGSVIIMAGSGMCTGGRIKHHLVNNISRPENTILFVGYQAQGTLGREILEKTPVVRIFGRKYSVKAGIVKINGLSAHADRDELLRWVTGFKEQPEKIFVIHGEESASRNLASLLKKKFKSDVIVPDYLTEHIL
jgi:metallo-beta-lactamase family protein